MYKKLLNRAAALFLCGAVAVTSFGMPCGEVKASDKVDTSDWQKSITIDFGVTQKDLTDKLDEEGNPVINPETGETEKVEVSDLAIPSQYQLKKEFGEDFEQADAKEFFGNMLYDNPDNTVQAIYGTTAGVSQKMGFDKVVPAGKVAGKCGEYFRDWVYAPDGETYKFSVDLPVGQYHVNVYTGNKVKEHDNTSCIVFNDESYAVGEDSSIPVMYNQTSPGSRQFYIPNRDNSDKVEKVTSYIVDVKDNGQGYGTLSVTVYDDKIEDEAYAKSHLVKASDVFNPAEGVDVGIAVIDTYEGTDSAIDKAAIADKLVTARLNGIEIAPVAEPVHATKIEAAPVEVEMQDIKPITVDLGVEGVTDRVFYESDDTSVVSVDNYYGEITANGIGTATIYAYNSYLDKTVAIPYEIVERKSVELSAEGAENGELTLICGEEGRDKGNVVAAFNAASSDMIEWSVDKEDVIKLGTPVFAKDDTQATSTLPIEALKDGQVTITATRKDNNERTAQIKINVINATKSVTFVDKDGKELSDDEVLSVEEGKSIEVYYLVGPENATQKAVVVKAEDSSIATAANTGSKLIITGKKAGETTVTVMTQYSNDIKDTVKIKVTPKPAEPTATPAPTAPVVQQGTSNNNTPAATPSAEPVDDTATQPAKATITLTGKATTKLALKKSVKFNVKAKGVKKVTCTIKKGKKLVKVSATKKAVKITAKKRGVVKLVITVKTKNGTKKFNRTIKIKK